MYLLAELCTHPWLGLHPSWQLKSWLRGSEGFPMMAAPGGGALSPQEPWVLALEVHLLPPTPPDLCGRVLGTTASPPPWLLHLPRVLYRADGCTGAAGKERCNRGPVKKAQ